MRRFLNLIALAAAAGLAGCSADESETLPPPAQTESATVNGQVQPAAVELLPSGGTIASTPAPAPDGTTPVTTPRDPNVPIVEGSAQDPNVLPPGFIPKPPDLEYTKNGAPNLDALSQALQVYCMWKKAVPGDMQELVSSKFMTSLPVPPAGKKYAIDTQNLTVVLVN